MKRETLDFWKRLSPRKGLKNLFSGWQAKEKIAMPVIVNLTTAVIIFLVALVFKSTVRQFFVAPLAIEEFPIYCVMEPYTVGDAVAIDLFIINLSKDDLDSRKLYQLALLHSPDKDDVISHNVEVRVKRQYEGTRILGVEVDQAFNENGEKGTLTPRMDGDRRLTVMITEIKRRAVLKLTIKTNHAIKISSRANVQLLPIEIDYAGRHGY